MGSRWNYVPAQCVTKAQVIRLSEGRKKINIMFSHLDTIPAVTDVQRDGRTRSRSKERAILCVVRVKTYKKKLNFGLFKIFRFLET